ncbi:hypothetical protein CMV_009096 [Castanea mollissima]|uniref:Cleavage and polyadenylation specificity factor subunit 2 n=1 Tax=Castanea mollissima TaxID=60419 RepID=A0A8J4RNY1_9ROSI|nr:hypothetical protein CMV_009096 [Castanea mollissima]
MGTSVQVTPLCGVYNENPLSYLVSIDSFNFLIDCGWNDHFDPTLLHPLSKVASTIDAVLVSHPDTLHLGALPYAMKQLGLNAPVYATEPVYRLGLLTMYEQFLSRKQISEFDLFTLDDIDSAFQVMTRLTYSQNHHLTGKGEGIVIAPHVAGHLLGGTMWKITKDGEDVIYAVDLNHRKERHLNGTVLASFVRPAVLITDAYNALNNQPYRRGEKENEFGETIKKTLGAGGNVLLPVDTVGRVLELILTLEQYWTDKSLNYPIFFLTYVASSTIDYVKSFLEWMSDSIAKSFEQNRENPFLLKHVRFCISKSELDNAPDGPKVVLASMASLEVGFSHDIFVEWATDAKNLVLFTERGQFASLARILQADPPPRALQKLLKSPCPGGFLCQSLVAHSRRYSGSGASGWSCGLVLRVTPHSTIFQSEHCALLTVPSVAAHRAAGAGPHGAADRVLLPPGLPPPSPCAAPMCPGCVWACDWDDFGEG